MRSSIAVVLFVLTALPLTAGAQTPDIPMPPPPPGYQQAPPAQVPPQPLPAQQPAPPAPAPYPVAAPPPVIVQPAPVVAPPPPVTSDAPQAAPPPVLVVPADVPPPQDTPPAVVPPPPSGPMLDGHVREGAFLSGPGSLAFILHHTLMAAASGLIIEGIAHNNFQDLTVDARTAMLAGTLIGAGLGFGSSAWWQFNHWIDMPAATYGIVNSVVTAMFILGLVGGATTDPLARAWGGFIGAELGAWLTATVGGGDLPQNRGLLIASGAGWGLAYGMLLLAIVITTGTHVDPEAVKGFVLLSPGIGAGVLALANLRYNPTSAQILRADVFGAAAGGAVLVLSALVLGFRFDLAVPYVLALLSSAGAITAVSLLWEESAERPALYHDPNKDLPYRNVWW